MHMRNYKAEFIRGTTKDSELVTVNGVCRDPHDGPCLPDSNDGTFSWALTLPRSQRERPSNTTLESMGLDSSLFLPQDYLATTI